MLDLNFYAILSHKIYFSLWQVKKPCLTYKKKLLFTANQYQANLYNLWRTGLHRKIDFIINQQLATLTYWLRFYIWVQIEILSKFFFFLIPFKFTPLCYWTFIGTWVILYHLIFFCFLVFGFFFWSIMASTEVVYWVCGD